MATTAAVAKMRFDAQERIVAALESKIDDPEKVEALRLAQLPSRDPDYSQAKQLELIADILEQLPESAVAQAADDAGLEESAGQAVEEQAEQNANAEQSDQRPHDEAQLTEEQIAERVKDNEPLAAPSDAGPEADEPGPLDHPADMPANQAEGDSKPGLGLEALSKSTREILEQNGYEREGQIANASDEDLLALDGIGQAKLDEIRSKVG